MTAGLSQFIRHGSDEGGPVFPWERIAGNDTCRIQDGTTTWKYSPFSMSTAAEQQWSGVPVNLFEAHRRVQDAQPVIRRDHGPNTKFLFSLAINEYVKMDDEQGIPALFRVVSIWQERVEFRLHTDARPSTIIGKTPKGRITREPGTTAARPTHGRWS